MEFENASVRWWDASLLPLLSKSTVSTTSCVKDRWMINCTNICSFFTPSVLFMQYLMKSLTNLSKFHLWGWLTLRALHINQGSVRQQLVKLFCCIQALNKSDGWGQQISNLLPVILKFTPHILVLFIFFSNSPVLLVQQQPDEE